MCKLKYTSIFLPLYFQPRTEDGEAAGEEDLNEATGATKSAPKKSTKHRKKKNPMAARAGLSADCGYGSGNSQGYLSGNSQGGCFPGFSQTTNGSSGYEDDASFEDNFVSLLQNQHLSDPDGTLPGRKLGKAKSQEHSGFMGMLNGSQHNNPTGQNRMLQHVHSPQSTQMPGLSPASQNFPPQLLSYNQFQRQSSANDAVGVAGNSRVKDILSSSSGYSSFRGSSPKVVKPGDDIDGSSVISSSHRSNLTSSFSTFSSNSSRVSSPCSNSDPLKAYNALSPAGNMFAPGQVIGSQGSAGMAEGNLYMKPSLRVNNNKPFGSHSRHGHQQQPVKLPTGHARRLSDEATRPWVNSPQSSRYSYSGSELSDDLLESLPTAHRRDSFSKSHPLPLPDSMQPSAGMGMEYENGMNFSSNHSQNGFVGSDATIPLCHYNSSFQGTGTQDSSSGPIGSQERGSFSQDGHYSADMYVNMMHSHASSGGGSNMVIGDMESFASTFSEETEYFASILQVNGRVK